MGQADVLGYLRSNPGWHTKRDIARALGASKANSAYFHALSKRGEIRKGRMCIPYYTSYKGYYGCKIFDHNVSGNVPKYVAWRCFTVYRFDEIRL